MSQEIKPLPSNNACPCGGDLLLARDVIEYTPVEFDADTGQWELGATSTEQMDSLSEPTIRLFCTTCGEYYEVPQALE